MVELLIRSRSHDPMVVANAISCLCALMEPLQLSLANPHAAAPPAAQPPQQAQPHAPQQQQPLGAHSPAKQPAAQAAAGQPGGLSAAVQVPHGSQRAHAGMARPGSGGSLGRSISMRTFC